MFRLRRVQRLARFGGGFLLIGFTFASVSGASALEDRASVANEEPPVISFSVPDQTVEYGRDFNLSATISHAWSYSGPWKAKVSVVGAPDGYVPEVTQVPSQDYQSFPVYVYPSGSSALPPGTYTPTITVTNDGGTASIATSKLVITPRPLGVEVRVLQDSNNSRNAIVSVRFMGEFVDNYIGSDYPSSGLSPGGTWAVEMKDATGAVTKDFTSERDAGNDVLAASYYWTDAPAGVYSVSAKFTATGASARNFAIAEAPPYAFTAAGPPQSSGSTATPAPSAPPVAEGSRGFAVPLWSLLLFGVVGVGLLGLVVVQLIRRGQRTRVVAAENRSMAEKDGI